jgi:hypothetical protein
LSFVLHIPLWNVAKQYKQPNQQFEYVSKVIGIEQSMYSPVRLGA